MNLQAAIDCSVKYLGERYTTRVGGTYFFAALAIAHWLVTEIDQNRTDDTEDAPTVAQIFEKLEDDGGWISRLRPGKYFIDIGADHLQITVGTNQVAQSKVLRVRVANVGEQLGVGLQRTGPLALAELLLREEVVRLSEEERRSTLQHCTAQTGQICEFRHGVCSPYYN